MLRGSCYQMLLGTALLPDTRGDAVDFFQASPASRSRLHIYVELHISVEQPIFMNSQELKRLLATQGCSFETHKGGSGHVTVRRGDRKSQLPMHGSRKELGKGLVNKILKDLGLK